MTKLHRLVGLAVILTTAAPATAATVISSSAYGIDVNLTVASIINASLGPLAVSSGVTSPGAYTDTATVLSLDTSLGLGVVLGALPILPSLVISQGISTGLITTNASSPFPVSPTGSADATVNNLGLSLATKLGDLPAITLLSIGSTLIQSTSSVEGVGAPSATGDTTLAGLTVGGSVLGALTIDGSLFVNPNPNTILIDLLGFTVILNEQIPTGDLVTSAGITTNAVHVKFTNFLLATGLLNGDIIVSNSVASITTDSVNTVPEPAVWLQMIVGFGLVGAFVRRQAVHSTKVVAA